MAVAGYTVMTPFGHAVCSVNNAGAVCELKLAGDTGPALAAASDPLATKVQLQLDEYFSGQRREFDLPLAPVGTEFQQRVWAELRGISYGTTVSYSGLAQRLGNPKAVRAVGRANALNPLWIIIPCHRVIGVDGSLTGYAGGLEVKRKLLELEGALSQTLFCMLEL